MPGYKNLPGCTEDVPGYRGRFAPSPTGALHAGSLVAALASWLDARAHNGQWLVRMEDVDTPRCLPGMGQHILQQLARCGLVSDAPVLWQSQRDALYRQALARLADAGRAYACTCSRRDIAAAMAARGLDRPRGAEWVYPGTCRAAVQSDLALTQGEGAFLHREVTVAPTVAAEMKGYDAAGEAGAAWRFVVNADTVLWTDRRLGAQQQNVANAVGDFVIRRKDGLFAYQLAVVVDDALQGITHVVRGQDLADNTARQIQLQKALGYATPQYLHTPLVLAADGHKLSKQNGAAEVATHSEAAVMDSLRQAARTLGLDPCAPGDNRDQALLHWTHQWRSLYTTP